VAVADGVDVELDATTVLDARDAAAVAPRGLRIDTPTIVVGTTTTADTATTAPRR
jgi:hypothetical protein